MYELTHGSSWQPADTPPNSDRWGDFHQTVTKLTVWVSWRCGLPIQDQLGSDPDPHFKQQSATVANTTFVCVVPWLIRCCACPISNGKSTYTQGSLKSQFLLMIFSCSPHHSHSHPHLHHYKRIQSSAIALYLSMSWSRVNTMYSTLQVQHQSNTVYLSLPTSITSLSSWPTLLYCTVFIPKIVS